MREPVIIHGRGRNDECSRAVVCTRAVLGVRNKLIDHVMRGDIPET